MQIRLSHNNTYTELIIFSITTLLIHFMVYRIFHYYFEGVKRGNVLY